MQEETRIWTQDCYNLRMNNSTVGCFIVCFDILPYTYRSQSSPWSENFVAYLDQQILGMGTLLGISDIYETLLINEFLSRWL